MTQKERQERSKEEIYRAAMAEFGSRGYDGANMEHICADHGISKGMMYHYYSSKDELFLLCAERTFRELTNYVAQGMDALNETDIPQAIKGFFMLREGFFRTGPMKKRCSRAPCSARRAIWPGRFRNCAHPSAG